MISLTHWQVARQFLNRSTPCEVLVLHSHSCHCWFNVPQFTHRSEYVQALVHSGQWRRGHGELHAPEHRLHADPSE